MNGTKPATLKLEGKLTGPWVSELERAWSSLIEKVPGRSVVVDLSEVSFVDSEGRKLLEGMHREGADLKATHLTTKHIVDEIKMGTNSSQKGTE